MSLDIGLIGATAIATRTMLRPSENHPDTTVRAVAAGDPDRAAEFAARNGIPVVHEDYAALIEDERVDLVYVSLHNSAHHHWAARAAAAGKHVVVEKPLCLHPDELAGIESVAAGVHVLEAVATAGHEWQAVLRAAIADGRYGALRAMRTELRFTGLDHTRGYRCRPELGGGIFFDAASYWVQAVQATIGLAGATGAGWSEFAGPNGVDTAFRARLTWPGGLTSTMDCSFEEKHLARHDFEFEAAVLSLRNVLLPMAAALPLNLTVRATDGTRTVHSFPAVGYYDRQFDRVRRLVAGHGEPWGAELAAAGERVRTMAAIHRDARRRHEEATR